MILKKTALIIGAGASRPYLFPTARELTQLLLGQNVERQNVPNDVLINMGFQTGGYGAFCKWLHARLGQHHISIGDLEHFQRRFRLSQFYSVDAFLAANPIFKELGALLIACILLKCEKEESLEGDWYQLLFNELVAEGKDFPDGQLSIVTFNYDRSLEMYLYKTFRSAYDLSEADAWAIVRRVKIIHVYGSLGPLPRMSNQQGIRYGNDGAMEEASSYIRLVQPRAESEKIDEIRAVIEAAGRVVFLGFGFDAMNLDAIGARYSTVPMFASCYNLSVPAMKLATKRLRDPGRSDIIKWGDRAHHVADFLHNSEALA